MILPRPEVDRFYRIWWALLRYTNARRQVLADWPEPSAEDSLPISEIAKVRDVLWADDSLREAFLAENPAALPAADLETVAGWQHRVADSFFVVRYLKKHTIFLRDGTPARTYGVVGLVSSFPELLGPHLPVHVQAVLLPFGNTIICDGLLARSNVTFGSGIRERLDLVYRDAHERGDVITSLPPQRKPLTVVEARRQVHARNLRLLQAFRGDLDKSGLSPKTVERHVSNVATVAGSSLQELDPPRLLVDITASDLEAYLGRTPQSVAQQSGLVTSFTRFVRFLSSSGRLDADAVWDFQDFLRGFRH